MRAGVCFRFLFSSQVWRLYLPLWGHKVGRTRWEPYCRSSFTQAMANLTTKARGRLLTSICMKLRAFLDTVTKEWTNTHLENSEGLFNCSTYFVIILSENFMRWNTYQNDCNCSRFLSPVTTDAQTIKRANHSCPAKAYSWRHAKAGKRFQVNVRAIPCIPSIAVPSALT